MVKEDVEKLHRDQVGGVWKKKIIHLDFTKPFGKDSHYLKNT